MSILISEIFILFSPLFYSGIPLKIQEISRYIYHYSPNHPNIRFVFLLNLFL